MTDLFHHGHGIHFVFGVLPEGNELTKELVYVGHVEVTRHYQVTAAPVALTQHRVTTFYFIGPVGTVAEMPKPEFARKSQVFL